MTRPPAASPTRSGVGPMAALALAGLLVGGGVGWLRRPAASNGAPGAGEAPPLGVASGGPRAAPAPARPDDAVARLRALLRRLEEAPAVKAALGLTDRASPDEAERAWRGGRAALAAEGAALAELVDALVAAPASPAVLDLGGRLALLEALLTRSRKPEPPLFPDRADPGLRRVRDSVSVHARLPALDAVLRRLDSATHHRTLAALSLGGRRWETVRSFEDIPARDRGEGPEVAVRILNWFGDPFLDPTHLVNDGVATTLRVALGHTRTYAGVPHVVGFDLRPPRGDLVLAIGYYDLPTTNCLRLDLIGDEEATWAAPSLPERVEVPAGQEGSARVVSGIRILAAAVPPGLRRARLSLRGLQPIGAPREVAKVLEVHQLVAGEVPRALSADPIRGGR